MPDRATPPTAIELTIPADVRYLAPARMVSTAVAADLGFSVDELDELRIAVNELLTVYLDAVPEGTRVTVCFESDGEVMPSLVVSGGTTDPSHRPATVEVDDLARRILTALTDSFTVDANGFELRRSAPHRNGS